MYVCLSVNIYQHFHAFKYVSIYERVCLCMHACMAVSTIELSEQKSLLKRLIHIWNGVLY